MKLILLLLILGVLLTSCVTGESIDAEDSRITIGVLLTQTGWGAYWGEHATNGAKFAEKDILAAGGSVKVIIEDSASDQTTAVSATQKMLAFDDIDGLYVEFAAPSSGASPIMKDAEKVLLYSAFDPEMLLENPYAFKTYFDAYEECKRMSEHALSKNLTNQVVMLPTLSFAEPCRQGALSTGANIQYEPFAYDATDFRSALLKVKDADVLIGFMYESHAINLLSQKTELGISTPLYCGGKFDCFNENVLDQVPLEALAGAVTFDTQIEESFIVKYLEQYPGATELQIQGGAWAYDGVMYLYEGFSSCDKNYTACVIESIISSDYESQVVDDGFSRKRKQQIESVLFEFDGNTFIAVQS
jgi:ABC-type branched-subunit amino acid transport system substrate-binding protein